MAKQSENANGDEGYEVEAVITRRIHRNKVQYLVKWTGYKRPSWTMASNCSGCQSKINSWKRDLPKQGSHSPIKSDYENTPPLKMKRAMKHSMSPRPSSKKHRVTYDRFVERKGEREDWEEKELPMNEEEIWRTLDDKVEGDEGERRKQDEDRSSVESDCLTEEGDSELIDLESVLKKSIRKHCKVFKKEQLPELKVWDEEAYQEAGYEKEHNKFLDREVARLVAYVYDKDDPYVLVQVMMRTSEDLRAVEQNLRDLEPVQAVESKLAWHLFPEKTLDLMNYIASGVNCDSRTSKRRRIE